MNLKLVKKLKNKQKETVFLCQLKIKLSLFLLETNQIKFYYFQIFNLDYKFIEKNKL